jgi:ribosomal protein L12E/L44/L45/RPP1/RPP2
MWEYILIGFYISEIIFQYSINLHYLCNSNNIFIQEKKEEEEEKEEKEEKEEEKEEKEEEEEEHPHTF